MERESGTCNAYFFLCLLLGFLTFGMNIFVCKGSQQYMYDNLPDFDDQVVIGNGELFHSKTHEGLIRNLRTKRFNACKERFGRNITSRGSDPSDLIQISTILFNYNDIKKLGLILIGDSVYDPSIVTHSFYDDFFEK